MRLDDVGRIERGVKNFHETNRVEGKAEHRDFLNLPAKELSVENAAVPKSAHVSARVTIGLVAAVK